MAGSDTNKEHCSLLYMGLWPETGQYLCSATKSTCNYNWTMEQQKKVAWSDYSSFHENEWDTALLYPCPLHCHPQATWLCQKLQHSPIQVNGGSCSSLHSRVARSTVVHGKTQKGMEYYADATSPSFSQLVGVPEVGPWPLLKLWNMLGTGHQLLKESAARYHRTPSEVLWSPCFDRSEPFWHVHNIRQQVLTDRLIYPYVHAHTTHTWDHHFNI